MKNSRTHSEITHSLFWRNMQKEMIQQVSHIIVNLMASLISVIIHIILQTYTVIGAKFLVGKILLNFHQAKNQLKYWEYKWTIILERLVSQITSICEVNWKKIGWKFRQCDYWNKSWNRRNVTLKKIQTVKNT